jgi:hypothetical protein
VDPADHEEYRLYRKNWKEFPLADGTSLMINESVNVLLMNPLDLIEASDEVTAYTTLELQAGLVTVLIEDPVPGRTSLYRWLHRTLAALNA